MGAFEEGSSFLAGVFAKIPEALRPQVQEALSKPEAKDAVTLIGESVLARSDYSRHMDALTKEKTELQQKLDNLNSWYATNQAALEEYVTIKPEYEALKAKGDGGDPPAPPPPAPPVDPRKIAEQVIEEQGRDFLAVTGWLTDKAQEHKELLGERLNTSELLADPRLGKPIAGQPGRTFSLVDAYNAKYGERVQQRQKELEEKRFNDEVEKRMRERTAGQPFPLRGDASPSVLDVLTTKEGPASHTLDTAVAEYERLQGSR